LSLNAGALKEEFERSSAVFSAAPAFPRSLFTDDTEALGHVTLGGLENGHGN
jgi:hypothetical protein